MFSTFPHPGGGKNRQGAAWVRAVPCLCVLLMKECGRGAPSPARTLMIHRAKGENNKRMDKNHL